MRAGSELRPWLGGCSSGDKRPAKACAPATVDTTFSPERAGDAAAAADRDRPLGAGSAPPARPGRRWVLDICGVVVVFILVCIL